MKKRGERGRLDKFDCVAQSVSTENVAGASPVENEQKT